MSETDQARVRLRVDRLAELGPVLDEPTPDSSTASSGSFGSVWRAGHPTQSAIARTEGCGARPILETLERLAAAAGAELVVGVGENLPHNRSIARPVREGHAVIRGAG